MQSTGDNANLHVYTDHKEKRAGETGERGQANRETELASNKIRKKCGDVERSQKC